MRVVKKLEFVADVEVALERVLGRRMKRLDAAVVQSLQADLRAEILNMLRRRGRRVRGMTKSAFMKELERSQSQLLTDRARTEQELSDLRDRVTELKSGGPSLSDIERRVREAFDSSRLAGAAPTRLERQILGFAAQVAQAELERAGRATDIEEVERLERRISKLTGSMSQMEVALSKLSKMKDVDTGVASIYRTVQGLVNYDEMLDRKQEMLRDIFESNIALKDELGS